VAAALLASGTGNTVHGDRTKPPIAEQGNTKDGWLFIMCNKEKFWTALAEAVGKPEWPRIRSIRRSQRV
jgi:crotonobetainyl-CoA:carnitine CoA-transferase CaiB-like acyl-CoA transferase